MNLSPMGIAVLLLVVPAAAFNEDGYDGKISNHPAYLIVYRNKVSNLVNKSAVHNLDFKIFDDDIGRSVQKDIELNRSKGNVRSVAMEGGLRNDRYYNHTEINSYIEYLAKRYSSRVVVKKVGTSFEGRDLKTITITIGDGRANKNVIFMDGGLHAREWISPATILYVIEQLVENFRENEELLIDYDFIILPVVNPDGYEYTQISNKTRYWRKTRQPYDFGGITCYGSDLNRNFGSHWNKVGSSSDPCSDTYAGPHAFSEPEAVVLRDIIDSLKGRGIFYLSLHAYGNFLLYPWGWTQDLPADVADFVDIATVGGRAIFDATGTRYETGSPSSVLYTASGSSQDYAYESVFKVAITMELPGKDRYYAGFSPDPSAIDGIVKESWIGIRAMCKRVIELYST